MFERSLREVTRSVRISYPVPYLVTLLLVVGLALFGVTVIVRGWEAIMRAILASLFMVSALGIVLYGVLVRPTLLKSETFMLFDSLLVAGDSDMDIASRERLRSEILDRLPEPRSERRERPGGGEREEG